MAHDSEYFRQRAAQARLAALRTRGADDAEGAGHLALAYAAMARRRKVAAVADPAAVSEPDAVPLMLND